MVNFNLFSVISMGATITNKKLSLYVASIEIKVKMFITITVVVN
jgi:hypothetical protein